jgi:hypothetical protein
LFLRHFHKPRKTTKRNQRNWCYKLGNHFLRFCLVLGWRGWNRPWNYLLKKKMLQLCSNWWQSSFHGSSLAQIPHPVSQVLWKKKKEETKVALHISYFILKLMYLFMNSATIKILSKKNVIVINLFNNCSLKSEHDDNYFNKINITNKAHLVDKAISWTLKDTATLPFV